jgi:hypothetical protein
MSKLGKNLPWLLVLGLAGFIIWNVISGNKKPFESTRIPIYKADDSGFCSVYTGTHIGQGFFAWKFGSVYEIEIQVPDVDSVEKYDSLTKQKKWVKQVKFAPNGQQLTHGVVSNTIPAENVIDFKSVKGKKIVR